MVTRQRHRLLVEKLIELCYDRLVSNESWWLQVILADHRLHYAGPAKDIEHFALSADATLEASSDLSHRLSFHYFDLLVELDIPHVLQLLFSLTL